MFAGIRKRLARSKQMEKDCDDDDKDDMHDIMPPANYIQISQGKIQLVHQARSLEHENGRTLERSDKGVLEKRMIQVEDSLLRLQQQFHKSQFGSPAFEKELREQIENMNRVIKCKERKQMQTSRDHKTLQTRFARQESLLHSMKQENRSLMMRIQQYEHCLDDVMRKVVDAIVAEDSLREEVTMLKSRVRDLEAQNAALSASPVKGRDEGYCTMSSGQPQPSNGHLEGLPEEPEQWMLPPEPCSTEMEDWSMSQEELAVITFDDDRVHKKRENDWLWHSNDIINSTSLENGSINDGIAQLLQQKIVYSEDEEVACTDFTDDFYKLVNICSNSTRSLYSCLEDETDDEADLDSSLSESQECQKFSRLEPKLRKHTSNADNEQQQLHYQAASLDTQEDYADIEIDIEGGATSVSQIQKPLNEQKIIEEIIKTELSRPPHILVKSKSVLEDQEPSCILRNNQRREIEAGVVRSDSISCAIVSQIPKELPSTTKQSNPNSWRRSNGWKRIAPPSRSQSQQSTHLSSKKNVKPSENQKTSFPKVQPTKIPTCIHVQHQQPQSPPQQQQRPTQQRKSKIPPPVPVRRSYAS